MAPEIVRQLGPHNYYFEGCFGGLSVLFAKAQSEHECLCDLHGAVTNLAWTIQNEATSSRLFDELQRVMYSDELYARSKKWLEDFEGLDLTGADETNCATTSRFPWAYHYFIASWMGRNGVAGTERANYRIATRWTQGGGSGPLRFRNAADSIPAWCERLRNVQILRRDLFELLPKIEDAAGTAIYVDPPYFPETTSGKSRYVHDFTPAQHARLAEIARSFRKARVVISYYATPKLAKLYPGWTQMDCSRQKHLHCQSGRGSTRTEAPECLLINGPIFAPKAKGLFG
jgi:DNA adenine methylase